MLGIIADRTGYGCVGLLCAGVHILQLGAFGVISSVERSSGKVGMDDYNGLYKTNPKLSVVMMLAMFSLAGIPPLCRIFQQILHFCSAIHSWDFIF